MATQITRYRLPWGETLAISADLTRAEAPITYLADEEEDRWAPTPYQTADARHLEREALRLVVEHLGAEWYADPSSDASREDQLAAALAGAVQLA